MGTNGHQGQGAQGSHLRVLESRKRRGLRNGHPALARGSLGRTRGRGSRQGGQGLEGRTSGRSRRGSDLRAPMLLGHSTGLRCGGGRSVASAERFPDSTGGRTAARPVLRRCRHSVGTIIRGSSTALDASLARKGVEKPSGFDSSPQAYKALLMANGPKMPWTLPPSRPSGADAFRPAWVDAASRPSGSESESKPSSGK